MSGATREAEGQPAVDPGAAQVFHVELHGLDPIPHADRRGHPRKLLWVWMGGSYNYVTLVSGALPILFGLSLRRALTAVVIGNLLGAILFGLCARHGPRTATATIVNTRAAFGHRGNLPAAVVSLFSVSGWVAVNSVLGVFALFQLFTVAGAPPSPGMKALLVALVLLVQMVIALYGHAMVMALEPVFAVASAVLLTGVLFFALPKVDWSAPGVGTLAAGTETGTFLLALSAMFAGPLSWANYAADYARYLPEDTDVNHVALCSGLGMTIANVSGCAIGALLATVVDMHDPLANIPRILPSWYLLLFLIAVICGAVANNVLNLYTAGLGLLALRVRAPRWASVLGIGVGASALTYIAVFIYNFMELYAQFLSLTLCFLSPWAAVLLVDYGVRRGHYDAPALHTWGKGRYWYRGGVSFPGIASYLLGIVAAFAVSSSALWQSPISVRYLGGADLSAFAGLLVAGALYFMLAGRRIRREQEAPRDHIALPG